MSLIALFCSSASRSRIAGACRTDGLRARGGGFVLPLRADRPSVPISA
jgi:hypothetical protein